MTQLTNSNYRPNKVLRPVHTCSRNRILCIRKQAILLPKTATKSPVYGHKVSCFGNQRGQAFTGKINPMFYGPLLDTNKMLDCLIVNSHSRATLTALMLPSANRRVARGTFFNQVILSNQMKERQQPVFQVPWLICNMTIYTTYWKRLCDILSSVVSLMSWLML